MDIQNIINYKSLVLAVLFASLCAVCLYLSDILAPFIAAFIVAYITRPIIVTLGQTLRISNTISAIIVFCIIMILALLTLVILLPTIYDQTITIISKIPTYLLHFKDEIIPKLKPKIIAIDPYIINKFEAVLQNFINDISRTLLRFCDNIWAYTTSTIHVLLFAITFSIALFYFMKDWRKTITMTHNFLPHDNKAAIVDTFIEIHSLLSAYIRGQLNICVAASAYYSIGLSIIGIDLFLPLGILSGFLIIVPLLGFISSLTISLIAAYFNIGTINSIYSVLALYAVGHIIEAYFLTPKIIGNRIGIHHLWILFSILATAKIFGVLGIFFAIPIAGISKILIKRGLKVCNIH